MKPHFAMLAAYNAWCNERIYAAAAQLSDADYRADRGAFFKSVHGTLNHILVADLIWLKRFGVRADAPDRLDAILHDTLADLRAARIEEDSRIEDWVAGLSEADLAAPISYRTMVNPAPISQALGSALMHLFNHQTHHRGQVHALMTAMEGRDFAPSLDLIVFQRTTGIGMS